MNASKELDVHILVSEDTRRDWVRQSIISVREAIKNAGFPVHLHVLPGIKGHIGKAREQAYALGSAPWKTYVDDDDYVLPNAFSALAPHLEKDLAAIFTSEYVEQNGQMHPFVQKEHHLQVYRADILPTCDYSSSCMSDVWNREVAKRDPRGYLVLDDITYVHRVYYDSKARVLRRADTTSQKALVDKFR